MLCRFEKSRNKDVNNYQLREQLISKLKKRFSTYSYHQVRTSTFEEYDMYAAITKTVNKEEMIKVIDSSGKVLVLRPDGTIPITRMTAVNKEWNEGEERLFYMLDVFRNSNEENMEKECTQAGVELFGSKAPEADAEVIMLAIHTLKDIGFNSFKIEIGHAGFFKELIEQANLTINELQQLQDLIQSKNITEMEPFLKRLKISQELQEALYNIPLLYGSPKQVLEQTKAIIRNERMQEIYQNLLEVMKVLEDYQIAEYITLNLGLINNMYYYTDIIFQGFVENIGKPVLMGGRYDHLSEQFGKKMAAIGFAYEIDFLLAAMKQHQLTESVKQPKPLCISYDSNTRSEALTASLALRNQGFPVITTQNQEQADILFTNTEKVLQISGYENKFSTTDELIHFISTKAEVY